MSVVRLMWFESGRVRGVLRWSFCLVGWVLMVVWDTWVAGARHGVHPTTAEEVR